jgi:hypothetical protein
MLCKNVLPLLSEFYDEILDADMSVQVSQHLDQCGPCRKEFKSLSILQGKLKSLKGVQAPEFLGSLVEHRLAEIRQNTWRRNLRNELELMWSKIRTTESTWYITKALGTVMTSLFFFLICGNNIPLPLIQDPMERDSLTPNFRQQVGQETLVRLGIPSSPRLRVTKSDPAINELYLNNLGESMSQPGKDDIVSVLAEIDSSGSAKIQNVIERPNDQRLLNNVNDMITSARCRPASKNGKAVSSHILFIFNKVSVYYRIPDVD